MEVQFAIKFASVPQNPHQRYIFNLIEDDL